MVLLLDCNSDKCAHVWSNLCYLHGFYIRWLIERVVKSDFIFGKIPCFHHSCATLNEQPSNIKTKEVNIPRYISLYPSFQPCPRTQNKVLIVIIYFGKYSIPLSDDIF